MNNKIIKKLGLISKKVRFLLLKSLEKGSYLKEILLQSIIFSIISLISVIILKLVLQINYSDFQLITISFIIGTIVSCLVVSHPFKELSKSIVKIFLSETLKKVFIPLLSSIIIVSTISQAVSQVSIRSFGTIAYSPKPIGLEMKINNTILNEHLSDGVLTASIPIITSLVTIDQLLHLNNTLPYTVNLDVNLDLLSLNLNRIERLEMFLNLEDGSKQEFLVITNGKIDYYRTTVSISTYEVLSIGVTSKAKYNASADMLFVPLQVELERQKDRINISLG